MKVTEIKKINNHMKAYEIIKRNKIKFTCPVLILHQDTGLWFTNPLIVDGNIGGDLLDILDTLYFIYNIDDMPFRLYSYQDVIEHIGEEGYNEYLTEQYYPVNGGEYYTDAVISIEEL